MYLYPLLNVEKENKQKVYFIPNSFKVFFPPLISSPLSLGRGQALVCTFQIKKP
jgi:hypothetical protein